MQHTNFLQNNLLTALGRALAFIVIVVAGVLGGGQNALAQCTDNFGVGAPVTYEGCTIAFSTAQTRSIELITPPGVASGDLLIAVINTDDDNRTIEADAGWELIFSRFSNRNTVRAFRRVSDGNDKSSYTFGWNGNETVYAYMMHFTGSNGVINPLTTNDGNNGGDSTPPAPNITASSVGDMYLWIGGFDDDDIDTTPAAGAIISGAPDFNITQGESGATGDATSGAAAFLNSTGAASGGRSFALTANEQWVTATLSIQQGVATPFPTTCLNDGLFTAPELIVVADCSVTLVGANVNNASVETPASTQLGDLLLTIVATDDNETITVPSASGDPRTGWSTVNVGNAGGNGPTLGIYTKFADAGDVSGASYNFTSGSTEEWAVTMLRLTGGSGLTPVAVVNGNSNTPQAPTLNTTPANTLVMRLLASDDRDITPLDADDLPTTIAGVEPIIQTRSSDVGAEVSTAAAYLNQPLALQNNPTANFSLTGAEEWRAATLGIEPYEFRFTMGDAVLGVCGIQDVTLTVTDRNGLVVPFVGTVSLAAISSGASNGTWSKGADPDFSDTGAGTATFTFDGADNSTATFQYENNAVGTVNLNVSFNGDGPTFSDDDSLVDNEDDLTVSPCSVRVDVANPNMGVCTAGETITISIFDLQAVPALVTDYEGQVQITNGVAGDYIETPGGLGGGGGFSNGAANDGAATYTFVDGDNGQVQLDFSTSAIGALVFSADNAVPATDELSFDGANSGENLNVLDCKFIISHSTESDVCSIEQVTISVVVDTAGFPVVTGYSGTITLDADNGSGGIGDWTVQDAVAVPTDVFPNDGELQYTFVPGAGPAGDAGSIILNYQLLSTNVAGDIDISFNVAGTGITSPVAGTADNPLLNVVNCNAIVSLAANNTNTCSPGRTVTVNVRNRDNGIPNGTIGSILLRADGSTTDFGDFTATGQPGTFTPGGPDTGIATYVFAGTEAPLGQAQFEFVTTHEDTLTIEASSTYIDFNAAASTNEDQTVFACEFRISFDSGVSGADGVSDVCSIQEMTISVFNNNGAGALVTDYVGSVSLTGSNGGWSDNDNDGLLTDDFPQDGSATIVFEGSDNGDIVLDFTTTTSGTLNFAVTDGTTSASNPVWDPDLVIDDCTIRISTELLSTMSVCESEVVTFGVYNRLGALANGFTGTLTISTNLITGDWATAGVDPNFDNATADDGIATYVFTGGVPEIALTFTNDSVEAALDFDAVSGSIAEDGAFDPPLAITGCIPSGANFQCFPGSDNGGTGFGNFTLINGDDPGRLVVMAIFNIANDAVLSANLGAASFTKMGSRREPVSDSTVEMWGALNSDLVAGAVGAGSHTASFTGLAANQASMCIIELSDVEQLLPILAGNGTSIDTINSEVLATAADADLSTSVTSTANNAFILSAGVTDRGVGASASWFNDVNPDPPLNQLFFNNNNQNPNGGTAGGSGGATPLPGLITVVDIDNQAGDSGWAHMVAAFNPLVAGAPEAEGFVPVTLFETLSGNLSYRAIGKSNRKSGNPGTGFGETGCDFTGGGYTAANSGSVANLTLPSGGSVVTRAYLYWVGSGDDLLGQVDDTVNFGKVGALTAQTADDIFLISGVGGGNNLEYFAGYKDVTHLMAGDGDYEVNGLTVQDTGSWADDACAGGWALIVVYSHPNERFRVVNLFHGLQSFQNSAFSLVPRNFRMQSTDNPDIEDGGDPDGAPGAFYLPNGQITHITIEGDESGALSGVNEILGIQEGPNSPENENFLSLETDFNPAGAEFNSTVTAPVFDDASTTGFFEFDATGGAFNNGYEIFGPGPDAVLPAPFGGVEIGDSFGFDIDTTFISGADRDGVLWLFGQPGLEAEEITTRYSSGQDLVLLVSEVISVTNFDIADLEVFKTLSGTPGEFKVGGTGQYVYTVTNNGNGTLTDGEATGQVLVSDILPAGLELVSVGVGTDWACTTDLNGFTCAYDIDTDCTVGAGECGAAGELPRLENLPLLLANVSVGDVTDFPSLSNNVINIARMQANGGSCPALVAGILPDPELCIRPPQFDNFNNLDGGAIDVNDVDAKSVSNNNVHSITHEIRGIETDLSLTKSIDGILETAGMQTYTLTVTNAGPDPTNASFTLVDNEPAGIDFTGVIEDVPANWTCTLGASALNCTYIASLGVGASAELTLEVDIVGAAGLNVTNAAQVAVDPLGGNFDNDLSNNTDSDTTTIVAPPVSSNERFLISTTVSTNDTNIGSLGNGPFENDDYFIYDPLTDEEENFYDDSAVATSEVDDANAVYLYQNGHLAISAGGTNTVDGSSTLRIDDVTDLVFGPEDIVVYDPILDTASLLFDGSAIFTDAGEDIDAVFVRESDGHIFFSTFGPAQIGATSFDEGDIVEYNPGTGIATIVFDSEDADLFGDVVQINGFYIRVSDSDADLTKDVFVVSINTTSPTESDIVGACGGSCDPGFGTTVSRDDIFEVDRTGVTTLTENLFLGDVPSGVFTTAGSSLEIDAIHVVEDGHIGHFAISQSQAGNTCEAGQYTITKHKGLSHVVDVDYAGSILISTTSSASAGPLGLGSWSLVVGTNALVDGGTDNGLAQYTFDAADNGEVTLALSESDLATINVNVTNGVATELGTEDPDFDFSNLITAVSYADNFGAALFSNDNGTNSFAGNWIETDGENLGGSETTTGNVLIDGGQLEFTTTGANPTAQLERVFNLEFTPKETVNLNFDFSYQFLNNPTDVFVAEVTADSTNLGSFPWTEVYRIDMGGTNLSPTPTGDLDLDTLLTLGPSDWSTDASIRFRVLSGYTGTSRVFIDNVEISTGSTSCDISSFDHYAIAINNGLVDITGNSATIVPGISCLRQEIAIFGHNSSDGEGFPNEIITIQAIDENLATVGGWTTPHVGSGPFVDIGTANDGEATYGFPVSESEVRLFYNYTSPVLTNPGTENINFNVVAGSGKTVRITEDPTLQLAPVFLNFYNDAIASPTPPFLPPQISGKASNVAAPTAETITIQVLKVSETDPTACAPFIDAGQTFDFNFALECIDSATCVGSTGATINGVAIANPSSNGGAGASTYTGDVPLTFANTFTNAGTAAEIVLSYEDAGNVQLHASFDIPFNNDEAGIVAGTPVFGESNVFTVRPFGLEIDFSNGRTLNGNGDVSFSADANGSQFAVAGVGFNTTISGVQYSAADDVADGPGDLVADGLPDGIPDTNASLADNLLTPNFGNDVNAAANYKVRVNSTTIAPLGDFGILSNNDFFSITNGFESHTMTFDEVGIIDLDAELLDLANATTNYLDSGSPIYGFVSNVGRFYPASIELQPDPIAIDSRTLQACLAPSAFTYLGEDFGIDGTLEAQNALGNRTLNYVDGFAKMDATDLLIADFAAFEIVAGPDTDLSTRLALGGSMPNVTWPANSDATVDRGRGDLTGNLVFNRQASGAEDGPFSAISIGLDTDDGDVIPVAVELNIDLDDPADGNDVALLGAEEFRYGRMRLDDAFGSETELLQIPLRVEYWDGSNFVINTDDSCTTLNYVDATPILSVVAGSALTPDYVDEPTLVLADGDIPIEPDGLDFSITVDSGQTNANDLDPGFVMVDGDRPFVVGPTPGVIVGPDLISKVGSVIVELDLTGIFDFLKYDWRTAGDLYDEEPEASGYNDSPRAFVEFGSYRGHDRVINWQEIYIGPD